MRHSSPSTKPVHGMRISCDKRWEEMASTHHGRFCDSCQKPVIDFTGWSREELIAWFKREPETCGMFERHQIDPRYIPVEHIGRTARRGFFAALAAFSLSASQAQVSTEPDRTEQTARTPGSDARKEATRPRPYAVNPKMTWEVCPAIPDRQPHRNKLRVYVSGQFPFIHVGKRRFRTVGCPTF